MKTFEIKIYGESIGVYNTMENIEDIETWTEIKEKVLGAVHRIELAIDGNKEVTGVKHE